MAAVEKWMLVLADGRAAVGGRWEGESGGSWQRSEPPALSRNGALSRRLK